LDSPKGSRVRQGRVIRYTVESLHRGCVPSGRVPPANASML
jgi:hypothetical protein